MMTPQQRYEHDLKRDDFFYDERQAFAVEKLQDLYDRLVFAYKKQKDANILSKLQKNIASPKKAPQKGLYFWGGVGRGKTYLVDVFYDSLPFRRKMRTHFHRFMQRVHKDLQTHAGQKNPMLLVADGIAKEAKVLCFDEFFVSDITDAMILGELTKALFERGVTIVATSNIPPVDLYKNGLQRERFLPAIALLQKHTDIYEIDAGIDYRLRVLEKADLYYTPLTEEVEQELYDVFHQLLPDERHVKKDVQIKILGRHLDALFEADDVVWFDFYALCDGPRSQNDYIELAREYHAVIVSDVPQMDVSMDDQVRRFINLIDEFYDRNVKLIISAQAPLLELYLGGGLEFEFQRTLSRLQEMQSHEYLEREHMP